MSWTLYCRREQVVFLAPLYAPVVIRDYSEEMKHIEGRQGHYETQETSNYTEGRTDEEVTKKTRD